MKYHIITFGCQINHSDSERISQFLDKEHEHAPDIKRADLVVVNMCSVRQSAVDRVYGLAPKLKGKRTILTGCMLKKDKLKLSEIFDEIREPEELIKSHQGVSGLIPIMKGCNNFCSYCVVPYTRGKEISRKRKEIVCEAKRLVKNGVKELWLLGQNVNSYKNDFPKLLREINNIKGKFWIRFTSSHPKDFSDALIKAMKECEKVTPYLNLPVQSGDNEILKKMSRPYTIEKYKKIIEKVKREIKGITVSTDIIVGFPSETKKQFENTKKLFEEIEYDMAYINKYSPRPGTAAEKMKNNISVKEKRQREKELTDILRKTAMKNNKRFVGKTIEVLPSEYSDGFLTGKSFHYKTVRFRGGKNLIGKFVKVKITNAFPWRLKGK